MPSISLKVPTLVRELTSDDQRYYYVRPLFINYPVITDYRYETALSHYKKELKEYLKSYRLNRDTLPYLLWHLFPTEIKYSLFPLDFKAEGFSVRGQIGVALLECQGKMFVALPSLMNFMFLSSVSPNQKEAFSLEIERVTKQLMSKIKRDNTGTFDAKNYLSSRKEFVTNVEQKVQIEHDNFSFGNASMQDLLSTMGGNKEFVGSIEIENVGQSLNYLYPGELKRAHLREREVNYLHTSLFQTENKTSLAIVGDIGSGRHTVLHESIWRYMEQPSDLRKAQVWLLNPNRIIAGMSIVGMWQKRFESILEFACQPSTESDISDTVLFDNPVALLSIGKTSQNSMNLSKLLKTYLEARTLQVILIATPEEWKILQEKDRRFSDLFQVMRIQPPEQSTAVGMVLHQRKEIERTNNCQFSIQAIHQLFSIHRVYLKKEALPGGVMKLMNQLASKYRGQQIDLNVIRHEFKSTFGLEERIFEDDYTFEPKEVYDQLSEQLIGQEKAVEAISQAVHLVKAKLANSERPLSSFLFIGPTGVGKTQAAKVLCKYLTGDEKHLLRFDMNEYVGDYAVQRLIGDEFQPEGSLTGKVRYRSFGVLLFDEIEKSPRNVQDLLLQVLDDGRLTDSLGRVVDFSNFIIIMTSNIGAQEVSRQISTTSATSIGDTYRKAVEQFFRPEFVNRIDEIVVFDPLEEEHILDIARLQIKELLQRDGFVRRTTLLNISPETLSWIAKRGYDKRMGGRALKRQIEKELTAISAEQLIGIQNENPIVFNVYFDAEQQKIHSKIHSLVLQFEQEQRYWNPTIQHAKLVYNNLTNRIKYLEEQLRYYQDTQLLDEEDNWQFYQLADKLVEIRESITITRLRLGEATPPYNTAFNIKKLERFTHNDLSISREIRYEIRENFRHNQLFIDKEDAPLVHYTVDVLLLEIACANYFKAGEDQLTLRIQSLLDGFGQYEILHLMKHYESLFKSFDWSYEREDSSHSFRFSGQAAKRLLSVECGIHLFYVNNQMPVPIQVSISKRYSSKVIRVYDGADTMTDLRSHYILPTDFSVQEHRLLLLAGFEIGEIEKMRN